MIKRLVFACVVLVGSASLVHADPITFTVFGTGGVSPAQTDMSNKPFWWIDTSGTMPTGAVSDYGFTPFKTWSPVGDFNGGGSLLLSSEFTMSAAETLEVQFSLLKVFFSYSGSDMTAPLGFALLLQDGMAPVVLANVTAEGRYNLSDDYHYSGLGATFEPTSPGVTTTTTKGSGVDVTLNDVHYAQRVGLGGLCGCFLDVTSTYTPGAGTYQLLFGNYDFHSGGPNDVMMGALAVTDIDISKTPEPASLALMGIGLAVGAVRRRFFQKI